MKRTIALLSGLVLMSGSCDEIKSTLNMAKCEYKYKSITDKTLAGVNVELMGPLNGAALVATIADPNKPLPLTFTLNLDVTNPNKEAASLSGGSYVLYIDNLKMTEGELPKFKVDAEKTAVMPVGIAFDLRKALSGESLQVITRLASNFAEIGAGTSHVKVVLKPKVVVAGVTLPSSLSPDVSIDFTVGGK